MTTEPKSWWPVVQKNRMEEENRVKAGLTPRFHAEKFDNPQNIKTSERAEKWIAEHSLDLDEKGNAKPSTARGKRRRERRNA